MDRGNAADLALGNRFEVHLDGRLFAGTESADGPDQLAGRAARCSRRGADQPRAAGNLVADLDLLGRHLAGIPDGYPKLGRLADLDCRRGRLFDGQLRALWALSCWLPGWPVPSPAGGFEVAAAGAVGEAKPPCEVVCPVDVERPVGAAWGSARSGPVLGRWTFPSSSWGSSSWDRNIRRWRERRRRPGWPGRPAAPFARSTSRLPPWLHTWTCRGRAARRIGVAGIPAIRRTGSRRSPAQERGARTRRRVAPIGVEPERIGRRHPRREFRRHGIYRRGTLAIVGQQHVARRSRRDGLGDSAVASQGVFAGAAGGGPLESIGGAVCRERRCAAGEVVGRRRCVVGAALGLRDRDQPQDDHGARAAVRRRARLMTESWTVE